MATNLDLAKLCEHFCEKKANYVLGAFGNRCTAAFLAMKFAQPYGVGAYNTSWKHMIPVDPSRICTDCYGLVKATYWGNFNGEGKYDPKTDRNEQMAFAAATRKGSLSTIPKKIGIVVWMQGHVGIVTDCSDLDYRNWTVIEAQGQPHSMQKRKLGSPNHGPWLQWFEDTYIDYSYAGKTTRDQPPAVVEAPDYSITIPCATKLERERVLHLLRNAK